MCVITHTCTHTHTDLGTSTVTQRLKLALAIEPSLKGLQIRNYCNYPMFYNIFLIKAIRRAQRPDQLLRQLASRWWIHELLTATLCCFWYVNIYCRSSLLILSDVESCWWKTMACPAANRHKWFFSVSNCECVFFFIYRYWYSSKEMTKKKKKPKKV